MGKMKERIKKLYVGKGISRKHWQTLRFHNVPLSKFFSSVRQINILSPLPKHEDNEIFVSINGENGRYYYATLTPEFKEWLEKNTFTGCSGIEVIQQRLYNKSTNITTFLSTFLIVAQESQIIGGSWLDYKSREEINGFFRTE